MSIQQVRWGLLVEWWCAPATATEAEVMAEIRKHFECPGLTDEVLRDRLFGGFGCEKPENRHIALATGCYSYTSNHQRPMTPEDRRAEWQKLIDAPHSGPEAAFRGGGPFTDDAPVTAPANSWEDE